MSNSTTPTAGLENGHRAAQAAAEFTITMVSRPGGSWEKLLAELAAELRVREATLLALFVFGDLSFRDEFTRGLRRQLGAIGWPILWVEGRSCDGGPLAGVQAFVVAGAEVERILVGGRVVGSAYADGDARHCFLAGVGPNNSEATREEQVSQALENARTALGRAGLEFEDIVRTWFYNDHLLQWYDVFNRVRTADYAGRRFRLGAMPASTGIEARNPFGAALTLGGWAIRPISDGAKITEVKSPRQCAAARYGSSFSRAVEIESTGRRRLSISGTASINEAGETIWKGDVRRQIATTMEVVQAILTSRGMEYADVTRAIAYFKHPADSKLWNAWREEQRVSFPAVCVHSDICRDDLLFELELDATSRR